MQKDLQGKNINEKIEKDKINVEENSTQIPYNCHIKLIELYLRTTLRHINIIILTHSAETQTLSEDLLNELNKAVSIIDKTFIVTSSFRVELLYSLARFHKIKFVEGIVKIQNEYIEKYTNADNKQYKELKLGKPYKDLCRNRLLDKVPIYQKLINTVLKD